MKAIARNILLHHLRLNCVTRVGRPRHLEPVYVLERIAYVLRTGCQWSNLPVENGSEQAAPLPPVTRQVDSWIQPRISTGEPVVMWGVRMAGLVMVFCGGGRAR
jgi:hypothetical protein